MPLIIKRRTGYNGFLKQGGRTYFIRAVEAVADVWYTVLQEDVPAVGMSLSKPSARTLTWYFVNEMEYLINKKNNMTQVEKVYANFERVNPQLMEAYEHLGDIFYANEDPKVKTRGVAEWQKRTISASRRQELGKTLLPLYERRQVYLERPAAHCRRHRFKYALEMFTSALDFNRLNEDAADLIQKPMWRYGSAMNALKLPSASSLQANAFMKKQTGSGKRATSPMPSVPPPGHRVLRGGGRQFKEHKNTAQEMRRNREVSDVINEVLDAGSRPR